MNDYATDEEQIEKIKSWWDENKFYVITGVFAGIAALTGMNWYKDMVRERGESAAAMFEELQVSVASGNRDAAMEKAKTLRTEFEATPFSAHASLALAKLHVEAGDMDDAMSALREAMTNGDEEISHVARLRLARVQLSAGLHDDAMKSLASKGEGDFSSLYQELRGDVLLAKGDKEGAIENYRKALDHDVPLGDVQYLNIKLQNLGASTE